MPITATTFEPATFGSPQHTISGAGRQIPNKIPEVSLDSWINKVLCASAGGTAADYLNDTLGFGLSETSYVMSARECREIDLDTPPQHISPWQQIDLPDRVANLGYPLTTIPATDSRIPRESKVISETDGFVPTRRAVKNARRR
jgi:hypothetical protein